MTGKILIIMLGHWSPHISNHNMIFFSPFSYEIRLYEGTHILHCAAYSEFFLKHTFLHITQPVIIKILQQVIIRGLNSTITCKYSYKVAN